MCMLKFMHFLCLFLEIFGFCFQNFNQFKLYKRCVYNKILFVTRCRKLYLLESLFYLKWMQLKLREIVKLTIMHKLRLQKLLIFIEHVLFYRNSHNLLTHCYKSLSSDMHNYLAINHDEYFFTIKKVFEWVMQSSFCLF